MEFECNNNTNQKNPSANASLEVKNKLQKFLLNKHQQTARASTTQTNNCHAPQPQPSDSTYSRLPPAQPMVTFPEPSQQIASYLEAHSIVLPGRIDYPEQQTLPQVSPTIPYSAACSTHSASLEGNPPSHEALASSYQLTGPPHGLRVSAEHPLRKTLSEPDVKMKTRLKRRVVNCRSSPLVFRPSGYLQGGYRGSKNGSSLAGASGPVHRPHTSCRKTFSSDYAEARMYPYLGATLSSNQMDCGLLNNEDQRYTCQLSPCARISSSRLQQEALELRGSGVQNTHPPLTRLNDQVYACQLSPCAPLSSTLPQQEAMDLRGSGVQNTHPPLTRQNVQLMVHPPPSPSPTHPSSPQSGWANPFQSQLPNHFQSQLPKPVFGSTLGIHTPLSRTRSAGSTPLGSTGNSLNPTLAPGSKSNVHPLVSPQSSIPKGAGVQALHTFLVKKHRMPPSEAMEGEAVSPTQQLSEAQQLHKSFVHSQAVKRLQEEIVKRQQLSERRSNPDIRANDSSDDGAVNETILEGEEDEVIKNHFLSKRSGRPQEAMLFGHNSWKFNNSSQENSTVRLLSSMHDYFRSEGNILSLLNDKAAGQETQAHRMTGVIYDPSMLKHQCLCQRDDQHVENPTRLHSIWIKFIELGVMHKCKVLSGRKVTFDDIERVHTSRHTQLYGNVQQTASMEVPIHTLTMLPCGGLGVDPDTIWHSQHSAKACLLAAGSVLDVCEKVARGQLANGFALVRPPGHHAEANVALGYCYFNNVAIAAKYLLHHRLAEKILIVDWDVHHGNGTEKAFYSDSRVLYFSLHRYDHGSFFPGSGSHKDVGEGEGLGYNINVPFSSPLHHSMRDRDYLAAIRSLLLPIASHFSPDFVLVSAGFDAAQGHPKPLGGYDVSPACFGWMTRQLCNFASGKVVLALEGGYQHEVLTLCAEQCLLALCESVLPPDTPHSPLSASPPLRCSKEEMREEELTLPASLFARDSLQLTLDAILPYWPHLSTTAPLQLRMSHRQAMDVCAMRYVQLVAMISHADAVAGSLASLSMDSGTPASLNTDSHYQPDASNLSDNRSMEETPSSPVSTKVEELIQVD